MFWNLGWQRAPQVALGKKNEVRQREEAVSDHIPTFQPANFGRVYAAYGGVFVVLSILWGWKVDRVLPDKFDLIGGFVALLGVATIMYWPRS